jgi:hypothetical protein
MLAAAAHLSALTDGLLLLLFPMYVVLQLLSEQQVDNSTLKL